MFVFYFDTINSWVTKNALVSNKLLLGITGETNQTLAAIHHTQSTIEFESFHDFNSFTALDCKAKNKGSLIEDYQKVYTWIDENGVRNFSDRNIDGNAIEKVIYTKNALDYFDLEIVGLNNEPVFKNSLESHLISLFRAYATLIGQKN
ncbi:hypothetical protein PALB_28430 [Pseudoalteromonas luteoviolacea B = ATCC 29581]|nr:hypothetical protein PALB_28430 [Pseudoalteromonas luteoviolacea B = ATCC 29581]